ncbi:MAG: hypothetical protein KKA73_03630 [Chloroflexi bacterium]|nr:hypothetical protein [Chloroflexota bacterium]MBU1746755.1 hypothetical protein [Chloroflexota bacterium]MBU1878565.1 hypothetical protein [Chloroflexota bacterium]
MKKRWVCLPALLVILALLPSVTFAAPANATTTVSGYAFASSAAALQAARTGSYAGGTWVTSQTVIRWSGSVAYTSAGWVVPCVTATDTTRTLNSQSYSYQGWDILWFQGLGQDVRPFWW